MPPLDEVTLAVTVAVAMTAAVLLSLPVAWWVRPAVPGDISAAAWGGFAYVTVFSMWLGFFAWYRGLAMGGALKVSQTQLLQPFLSILAAVPLLGEALEGTTLAFAGAVVATVFLGKYFATRTLPRPQRPAL